MEQEKKYGTLVTNVGTYLITNATMNGEKVKISQFAVGDGGGDYYQPTELMTELKNEVWRGRVGSAKINEVSPNMIDVVTVVPSNVGGFTIREMAVFDEENNMIAICNTAAAEKVVISSGEVSEMKLTMHITVSNTAAIEFLIDPTVIVATKKDLENHNNSTTAHGAALEKKAEAADLAAHTHNSEIHVTQAMTEGYNTAIQEIGEHVNDTAIHVQPGEREGWGATSETAEAALAAAQAAQALANQQAGQIARLEDGLFSNITGNPFLITFENLDGIALTRGTWNEAKKRLEC